MEPSKIVARYCDGRTLKGTTQNFFPNKPVFHVNRLGGTGPGDVIEVNLEDPQLEMMLRPQHIIQALLNLVINAIEASPTGATVLLSA